MRVNIKVSQYIGVLILWNYYNSLCEPSQKGGFFVCLHMHIAAVLDSLALKTDGEKLVPLWKPLHQGWFADIPQAHQAYVFPNSNCSICGALPAIFDFFIFTIYNYLRIIQKRSGLDGEI